MSLFTLKRFSLQNEKSSMKIGTDSILLGAAATLPENTSTILDVGTGTGIVAIMLAQRCADAGISARITGIDIDKASAEESEANFSSCPWSGNLTSLHSSLEEYKNMGTDSSVDLIVSNPPYYDSTLTAPDSRRNVSRHTGVDSEGGTSLSPEDVIAFASQSLSENGILSMIVPSDFQARLDRFAKKAGLSTSRILLIRTTETKAPKRMVIEFGRHDCDTVTETLVLKSGRR